MEKMPKRQLNKSFKITLYLMIFIFTLSLAIASTYAWISFSWGSTRNVTFTTDDTIYPQMNAWIFDADNEDSGEALDKNSGSWRSILINSPSTPITETSYEIAPIDESGNDESTERITFRSLHLGTVDNLLNRFYDNFLYIRFDITGEDFQRIGENVRIKYSITKDDVILYDEKGQLIDKDELAQSAPNAAYEDIIIVECVLTTLYFSDPSQVVSDNNNQVRINDLFSDDYDEYNLTVYNNQDFARISEIPVTEEYYVYVRISPDLEQCALATEYLSIYMPCELIFNLTLEIEFDAQY